MEFKFKPFLFRKLLPWVLAIVSLIACQEKKSRVPDTEKCIQIKGTSATDSIRIAKAIHATSKIYRLDTLFQHKAKLQGFNGTVLIAQKGIALYRKSFGFAKINQQTPLTIQHCFQLASLSKTFTGTAALMLVQAGKLSLDDSVQKFFPGFPYPGVTIGDLLSHRSGLPNYLHVFDTQKANGRIPNNDSIIQWLMHWPMPEGAVGKPGVHFSYNNSNFVLLASIIEKVSGLTYPEYLNRHIFSPLGMNHTFVDTLLPKGMSILRTSGHQGSHERERDFYDGVYGDKGIWSDVDDLLIWYKAIQHHCLLNKYYTGLAFTPRSFERISRHNYGYGFRIMTSATDPQHAEYVYHGGWWAGYCTMFWMDLKNDFVIIILSNKKSSAAYEVKPIIEILGFGDGEDSQNESSE